MRMESAGESDRHDFEKMRTWEHVAASVDKMGDRLGLGIDEGIRETVIAFNLSGIQTDSSCEGHLGSGLLFPWVGFSAPDEPEERFEGEKDLAKAIALSRGVSEEDVVRARDEEAWKEWRMACFDKQETSAYKKWREENVKMAKRAEDLLGEFYRNHTPNPGNHLVVNDYGRSIRVHADSEHALRPLPEKNFSESERRTYLALQDGARAEMRMFTKFLRERYFPHKRNAPKTKTTTVQVVVFVKWNEKFFRERIIYFTASFNALAARNFGTVIAGTCTVAPVRGLRAARAARFFTEKMPRPAIDTSPPLLSVAMIASSIVSIARSASAFVTPIFS